MRTKIICVNKHKSGRIGNVSFGILGVIDGLVRILSFGFLHTDLQLMWARRDAARHIAKQTKAHEQRVRGLSK